MVLPGSIGLIGELEKKFGLPQLSKVAESLQSFPDAKQLRMIRDILLVAERLPQNVADLDKVLNIIQAINSMSPEQLKQLEKVLKRMEKIMRQTPKEIIEFISSLKG